MTKILIEIDTDTQRVVPAIPTDEIYTAACDALSILFMSERFDAMYAAMLAAAPQHEPVDVWQPVDDLRRDVERLDWLLDHSDATICSDGAYGPHHVWFRYSNRITDEAKTKRAAIDLAMSQGEQK